MKMKWFNDFRVAEVTHIQLPNSLFLFTDI
jgi:hypothetical protein